MSEKSPRRIKKEESPEPAPNPELARLIEDAQKGNAPAAQDIQPPESSKRIISRENDAYLQSQLKKFDSLNFTPGFPPEELFDETPSIKEAVSNDAVDAVLAKITVEKKLTGAKVLNYLNDMGGTSASPQAIEKIMTVASERLDKDVFEKLQTIVSPSQVKNEKVPDEVNIVEVPQVPENLSSSDFDKFVHTGEVSEDILQSIAQKIIDGKPASKEETAIVSEKSKQIEEILNAKKSAKESVIDTKLDVKETVPGNLPGSSPEELQGFATTFLAGEEGKNNKLSQEPMAGLPGRDKDGNFNSETIRRAWSSGVSVEVKVKRSSGDVEDGWFVTGSEGQNATVSKAAEGGGFIIKVVPLEELNDLNRIESHPVSVPEASMPTKKESATDSVRAQNIRQRIEELNHEAAGHTSGYVRTGEEIQTEVLALETELKNLERIGKPTEGTPTPEEAPQMTGKGSVFTDAQKERLSKEFDEQSEGTPKEWREKLRDLIHGADKRFEAEAEREILQAIDTTGEQGERGKEYVAERLKVLQEEAKEYGPTIIGMIGSVVERYNKLNWKTKLAITGVLMLGAAYMPVAAGAFTAALYGQRVLGAIGMGMNQRKKLDAKIVANPEHWLAGNSELAKNAYVTLLSAGYMAATSFAVHEGVEGLKAAANSDWLPNSLDWTKTTAQEGFEKVKESANTDWLGKMLGHDSIQPSSDALEALVPTPDIPSVEVPPDQAHTVQTLDPTLFAEAKGTDQLRILAENSISKHLTPNEWAVLNNHIASLTSQERSIFDKFVADSSAKIDATSDFVSTAPESAPVPDLGIPEAEASTREHLKDLNAQWDKLYEERDQVHQDIATAQAEGSDNAVQELSGAEARIDAQMHDIKQVYESAGSNTPFGRDPIDGHPMSELEAQKLSDLQNAMRDPRQTGVWPPGPPEEKGFFEKLFGGDKNAAETVTTPDHIPTLESGVYPLRDGHFFAESDSIEGRLNEVQKFLTANPSETVYSLDDSGKYQIPWHLVDSVDGKKIPMPDTDKITNGGSFLGFGSRFISAPTPEDFAQQNPLEYSAPAAPVEIPKVDIDTAPTSGEVAPPPAAENIAPESEMQAPAEVETSPVDTGTPHTSGEAATPSATESVRSGPEISSHSFESIKAVSAEGKFSYSTDGRPLSFDLAHGDLYPSSLMDYGKKFLVDNYENMVPLNNPKANAQQILSEVFFHKQALEYLVGIGGNNSPEADFLRGDIKLLSERVERLYGPIFKK